MVSLSFALLLASPALAGWGGPGGAEPDTRFDIEGGLMWPGPYVDDSAVRRVYFNGFAAFDGTALNPNVGVLGTSAPVAPLVIHRALLGVWRDCNADGYIGLAEGALQDYRTESLLDSSVCPAGTPHNDGSWVSELLMVGMVDPCEYHTDVQRAQRCPTSHAYIENPRVIYANDTFVWADDGRPGDAGVAQCPVQPLPSGTTSGTGALLRVADCHAGHVVARSVNGVDGDGSLGLRFDDETQPQHSDSLLNHHFPVNLFGNPVTGDPGLLQRGSGSPTFSAWDCSEPRGGLDVRDPTAPPDQRGDASGVFVSDPTGGGLTGPIIVPIAGRQTFFRDHDGDASTPGRFELWLADDQGSYVTVPTPAPTLGDPRGSLFDAADATQDGVAGDCDGATPSTLHAEHPGESIERSREPSIAQQKARTSHVFKFYDGYRGIDRRTDFIYPPTAPADAGVAATRNTFGGALWLADTSATSLPPITGREELGAFGATYVTYYAHLDAAQRAAHSLTLPAPGARTYGADACPSIGQGAPDAGGWICDPTKWWKTADGTDTTPRFFEGDRLGRVVGDSYHLRDVDCLDGTVLSLPGACDRG